MSLTEISTRLGVIAGLAIVALLVIGWRQPVRKSSSIPSGPQIGAEINLLDEANPLNATAPDIRETIARKVLDASGLAAIALFGGILVAITIATTLSFIVTSVISRL